MQDGVELEFERPEFRSYWILSRLGLIPFSGPDLPHRVVVSMQWVGGRAAEILMQENRGGNAASKAT